MKPTETPFGAPGLTEEERLRRFALRALELVAISERERAAALAQGTDLPPHWGDRMAMAAARWGLLPKIPLHASRYMPPCE